MGFSLDKRFSEEAKIVNFSRGQFFGRSWKSTTRAANVGLHLGVRAFRSVGVACQSFGC